MITLPDSPAERRQIAIELARGKRVVYWVGNREVMATPRGWTSERETVAIVPSNPPNSTAHPDSK